eukprot:m.44858 g.44858  ORF g.44858 m.44858 type:complete len:401 (-) comp10638_c0_seq1:73-1275(-)
MWKGEKEESGDGMFVGATHRRRRRWRGLQHQKQKKQLQNHKQKKKKQTQTLKQKQQLQHLQQIQLHHKEDDDENDENDNERECVDGLLPHPIQSTYSLFSSSTCQKQKTNASSIALIGRSRTCQNNNTKYYAFNNNNDTVDWETKTQRGSFAFLHNSSTPSIKRRDNVIHQQQPGFFFHEDNNTMEEEKASCSECNLPVSEEHDRNFAIVCDACGFRVCVGCWLRSSCSRSEWTCPRCLSEHRVDQRKKLDFSMKSSLTTQSPRQKRILADARECSKALSHSHNNDSSGPAASRIEIEFSEDCQEWEIHFFIEGNEENGCSPLVARLVFPSEYPSQSPIMRVISQPHLQRLVHSMEGLNADGWLCLGDFMHTSQWSSRIHLSTVLSCIAAQFEDALLHPS